MNSDGEEDENALPPYNDESGPDTAELEELYREEAIGSTLYKKHWVLNAIMDLCIDLKPGGQVATSGDDSLCSGEEPGEGSPEDEQNLSDLRTLVQMSQEEDVAEFLLDNGYLELFDHVFARDNPEYTELTLTLFSRVLATKRNVTFIMSSPAPQGRLLLQAPLKLLMLSDSARLIAAACRCLKEACFGLENVLCAMDESMDEEADVVEGSMKHDFLAFLMCTPQLPTRLAMLLSSSLNEELLAQMSRLVNNMFSLMLEHAEDEFLSGPFNTPDFGAAVASALETSSTAGHRATAYRLLECLGQLPSLWKCGRGEQADANFNSLALYVRGGLEVEDEMLDKSVCVTARVCAEGWTAVGGVHQGSYDALREWVEAMQGKEELADSVSSVKSRLEEAAKKSQN